jgi:hypothetical protein
VTLRLAAMFVIYASFCAAQVIVNPPTGTICPGESMTFTSDPGGAAWALAPAVAGVNVVSATGVLTVNPGTAVPASTTVTATVSGNVGHAEVFVSGTACRGGNVENEARAVIGFQQAGASAAKAEQNFFFDFFIDRRLPRNWMSLWGDVRVASYPQQINTPVAQFDVVTQVGQLKVNELAETAEFSSGLDIHPWPSWDVGNAMRRFGIIFSVGASGPFNPQSRLNIFQVPATASPQYNGFVAAYPQAKGSTYVGFIPPDRTQFYRAWGVGFRLTTTYREHQGSHPPPATYTVTFGQDEAVTGGQFKSAVGKVDVFYPLPIGLQGYRFIYLFGNASLQLKKANNYTPFVLSAAPANITGSEPSVAIIPVASNRDVYRIGVGVDAIALVCAIAANAQKPCH